MKLSELTFEAEDNIIPFRPRSKPPKQKSNNSCPSGMCGRELGVPVATHHPKTGVPNLQPVRSISTEKLQAAKQRREKEGTADEDIFQYTTDAWSVKYASTYHEWREAVWNHWSANSHPINADGIEQMTAQDMDLDDTGDVVAEFDFVRNTGWYIWTPEEPE